MYSFEGGRWSNYFGEVIKSEVEARVKIIKVEIIGEMIKGRRL